MTREKNERPSALAKSQCQRDEFFSWRGDAALLFLSAKKKTGIDILIQNLTELANIGALSNNETIVSNSRHFEALNNALNSLKEVQKGLDNNISSDLFAIDIRQALHYLGEITGEITTEDLLGNIFANFCIGK